MHAQRMHAAIATLLEGILLRMRNTIPEIPVISHRKSMRFHTGNLCDFTWKSMRFHPEVEFGINRYYRLYTAI